MTLSVQVFLYDNETFNVVREESYEFLHPQISEEVFESCDRYVYSEHLRRGHNPQVKYKN